MITNIPDAERALSAQIDEQGGQLVAWRDRAIAAEQASKWESDLCGQALEDRNASETKHAILVDEFEAVRKERDELREGIKRYDEMADMASAEIAVLTAELARLRALLTRSIDHVSYGSRRSYDGVGGYKMREAASHLLLEIMNALAAPPAQPAEPVQPGWRDIESAPKDGTEVALHEAGRVFRGFWFETPFKEYRDDFGNYIDQQDEEAYWMDIETGDSTEPTEWQARPLPPAPKATK